MTAPSLARPRPVLWLLIAYLVVSWATVALVVVFSFTAPALATPQAWVRSIIVAATSVLTLLFGVRAARGRPQALLRLRIAATVILVAIVGVVAFLPLPTWMVVEQIVCGILLLAVVVLAFVPARAPVGAP